MNENERSIMHSNTITGNNLNNNKILNIKNTDENKMVNTSINTTNEINRDKEGRNINRGTFAIGANPDDTEALNIFYEQSKAKEAYKNYRNYLRESNGDARNKSSPFPVEQFGIDKDIDESKLIEGQKPLN